VNLIVCKGVDCLMAADRSVLVIFLSQILDVDEMIMIQILGSDVRR